MDTLETAPTYAILDSTPALQSACLALLVLQGLLAWRAFRNTGLRTNSLMALGWVGITLFAGALGAFRDFTLRPPPLMLVAIASFVMLGGMVYRTARAPSLIAPLTLATLVGLQWFRFPLELILHELYGQGLLPKQMTFMGSNFDIAFGVSALPMAHAVKKHAPWLTQRMLWTWNVLGILSVMNVAGRGILSAPTPLQQFFSEPMNRMPAVFPYIGIVTCFVPMAIGLHILSLIVLKLNTQDGKKTG